MMYEQKMANLQTRSEAALARADQIPAEELFPQQEDLKTMLDTANCLANENKVMVEQLNEFLFGLGNGRDVENRKEPGCFRDALQTQIDVSAETNKKLHEIFSRLGA